MDRVGKLVARLRTKRRWTQGELGVRCGFSRDYVANGEWTGKFSTRFLKKAEDALEVDRGSLIMWNLLERAHSYCRREGIDIKDHDQWYLDASRAFRHAQGSGKWGKLGEVAEAARRAADPETRQERARVKSVKTLRRFRSLMSTRSHSLKKAV